MAGAVTRLPVDDKTPQEAIDRMEALSQMWGLLPNDPYTAAVIVAWPGMDIAKVLRKAAFDALIVNLRAKQTTFVKAESDWKLALAADARCQRTRWTRSSSMR